MPFSRTLPLEQVYFMYHIQRLGPSHPTLPRGPTIMRMRYATFSTFSRQVVEHCIQVSFKSVEDFPAFFTCFESALIALGIVVLSSEFLVIALGPRMLVLLAETITFSPQGGVLFGELITSCLSGFEPRRTMSVLSVALFIASSCNLIFLLASALWCWCLVLSSPSC